MIYVTLVAFGVLVTVVSTIENFRAIAKNMSTYGKPFSCHCTDIWNTCDWCWRLWRSINYTLS